MNPTEKPLDQPSDLKQYYRDHGVVDQYMGTRTQEPLNGVLHARQVQFLNRAIAERRPERVLEIACGPGRLTAEMRGVTNGVAMDASPAMLATARKRTQHTGQWSFLRGDAFVLPFRDATFDAVYTLRFIRHFQLDDRQRLYQEIQRVLTPQGAFMVEALNRDVSYPFRVKRGLHRYHIYDVLYRREELEAELDEAGFRVTRIENHIQHHDAQRFLNRLRRIGGMTGVARMAIQALENIPSSKPAGWMLLCEKKG